MDSLKIARTRLFRGVRVMRSFAGVGLFAVALLAAAQARADVTLGPGETLTGLVAEDCTLVHDVGHGMKAKLVRTESALLLRVIPSGITVIFR